ncbi:MAG TPA: hypothetical protein DCG57_17040 [Candidatus Riflebacteria bacterium]|jgi:hypothetical protein|nr:hypothetical protein [Candidatus Riflebacteria bacterium]
MSEQNSKQSDPTGQGQDALVQAPTSPQTPKQQLQPVQAKPERPVFPSNSLLTEASQRMETPVVTKIDTTKNE